MTFIEKLNRKYPKSVRNYRILNLKDYVNLTTKLYVHDFNGICFVTPKMLLRGASTNIKSAINKTDYFINKSIKVHGNKYNYKKCIYVNSKTKVKIICPIHGLFEQRAVSHSLGRGCQYCANIINVKQSKNKKSNTLKFIEKALKVHGDLYDYSLVDYKLATDKIKIICKIHGTTELRAYKHLNGRGCKYCGFNRRGVKNWLKNCKCKYKVGCLYVIKCWNETEEFYKVGKTVFNVSKRYNSDRLMPYKYKIIYEIFNTCELVSNVEIDIKRKLHKYRYIPKIYFSGSKTECFKSINIDNFNLHYELKKNI